MMTRSSTLYWQHIIQMSTGEILYQEKSYQKLNAEITQDISFLSSTILCSALFFLVYLFVRLNECTFPFYYTRQWIFTPNIYEQKKEPLSLTASHNGFAHIIIYIYNLTNLVLSLFVIQLCLFGIFWASLDSKFDSFASRFVSVRMWVCVFVLL